VLLTASDFVDSTQRRPATPPVSSTPRGPPRKPKQSGHALWVGNLPPSANVEDLKDHFSRDTTNDIESVFLISRSNCAFVNYRTETACNAAMTRFHDSRFQGVRLVCRLRRGLMAPGSGSNVAAMSTIRPSSRTEEEMKIPAMDDDAANNSAQLDGDAPKRTPSPSSRVPDRFFIVKSLTVEDLELSKRSGIWATQTHNEANLNKAYEVSDGLLCRGSSWGVRRIRASADKFRLPIMFILFFPRTSRANTLATPE
jgi:RNA recognition motif-containing protein